MSSFIVNWGDGHTDTYHSAGIEQHAYSAAGEESVSVSLVDAHGLHAASGDYAVNVLPVNPTLAVSGTASVMAGSNFVLSLQATGAGSETLTTWMINWGDGVLQSVPASVTSASHTYAASGNYSVAATATNGAWTGQANVQAVQATPLPDTTPPTANLSGPSVTNPTSAMTFTVTYTDDHTVNVSSIGNGNVLVTGINGFSAPAIFLGTMLR